MRFDQSQYIFRGKNSLKALGGVATLKCLLKILFKYFIIFSIVRKFENFASQLSTTQY